MPLLNTADHQQLYYACFGAPTTPAVLFLHGGPGGRCNPADAAVLNPEQHFVIQIDQPGCGASLPTGSLQNNTTQALIADLEQLRSELGIEDWQIYGGSWGASLALEYAKAHTERVTRLVLRGSFLAREEDLAWFFAAEGAAQLFPEAYQNLLKALALPANTTESAVLVTTAYQQLLAAEQNPERAYQTALAISNWNAAVMRVPTSQAESAADACWARIQRERIFMHYGYHQFFLSEHGVLAGIERLADLPITLVHGTQDQVCPIAGAYALLEHLPKAELIAVEAGHGLHEKAIWTAVAGLFKV